MHVVKHKNGVHQMIRKKMKIFGHICRMNNERLIKTVMLGTIDFTKIYKEERYPRRPCGSYNEGTLGSVLHRQSLRICDNPKLTCAIDYIPKRLFRTLSNLDLNCSTVVALTTTAGSAFQAPQMLYVKKISTQITVVTFQFKLIAVISGSAFAELENIPVVHTVKAL